MVQLMIAAGVAADMIALAVETAEHYAQRPPVEFPVDRAAENRRHYDRERHRKKALAKRLSTGIPPDSAESTGTTYINKKEEVRKEVKKVSISRLHPIPPEWHTNEQHARLCRELGVPLMAVETVFREDCAAKNKLYANHDMAFNTYIRNFNRYHPNGGNGHGQPRNRLADLAHEVLGEVRQREFDIGLGRPAENERGD